MRKLDFSGNQIFLNSLSRRQKLNFVYLTEGTSVSLRKNFEYMHAYKYGICVRKYVHKMCEAFVQ